MIIGVSGRARSGKDTLANLFIREFNFKRISFADSLKDICSVVFSIDVSVFHDNILKDKQFGEPIVFNSNHAELLIKCLSDEGIVISEDQEKLVIAQGSSLTFSSPRDILQKVGTDLCRKLISDSVWIDIFKNKIGNSEGFYIVADVRFKNEREAIKTLNGINILVIRESLPELTANCHESELLGCSPYLIDVTVLNDSTIINMEHDVRCWWYNKLKGMRI